MTPTHLFLINGPEIVFISPLMRLVSAQLVERIQTARGLLELVFGILLVLIGIAPVVIACLKAASAFAALFASGSVLIYTGIPMAMGLVFVADVLRAHRYVYIEVRVPKLRRVSRVPKSQRAEAERFVAALNEAMRNAKSHDK